MYGIRPTNLQLGTSTAGAQGRVVVVEPTGAETEVVLDIGGQSLVAVHPGRIGVMPKALVGVGAEAACGRVFDKRSGKRLN